MKVLKCVYVCGGRLQCASQRLQAHAMCKESLEATVGKTNKAAKDDFILRQSQQTTYGA